MQYTKKNLVFSYFIFLYPWIVISWKHYIHYKNAIKKHFKHTVCRFLEILPEDVKNCDYFSISLWPHQWRSSFALKTARQEVPSSIHGSACRPSRLKFSMVFSKTHLNTSYDRLKRPHKGHYPCWPRSHRQTIGLKTYNN